MNTHLHQFAAAAIAVAGLAIASSPAMADAPIRICTFPGSPSAALDKVVAKDAFKAAGIAATLVENGIGGGDDDDGVSLKELRRTLGHGCDVIAGFPRSSVADASGNAMRFSRGYLDASYVSVEASAHSQAHAAEQVVAATYGSPSQLIAVQEQHAHFDLENTPELTVDAVASGRAVRAIVWYPAVVAYQQAHGAQQFDVRKTRSPYSDWQLVFALGSNAAALQRKLDGALTTMAADGRLATLTQAWTLPESRKAAQAKAKMPAFAYLDGPVAAKRNGMLRDAGYATAGAGHIVKISAEVAAPSVSGAPSFDRGQVAHGKALYGSSCAKCHGANMQGITAPALSGPAFAPASGSHLTIGGIYTYMSTNMPADRPGKLKDSEYADIMAYLLSANGYAPAKAKLTADSARTSTVPLNAGPLGVGRSADGTSTASAK
ncbi:cytochrome C [Trinickia dabaoshanensis]|uniref:Cytochrome C n=1 Tax=Trinickia dabaoshanensis TaxID=564714 RepID=A0A2N7VD16_9BURK|nr:c-type cytochrome [Trinickia dabaoshanensis]PMS15053.1 cytochrome C [Trinickia dabaoshanensis]